MSPLAQVSLRALPDLLILQARRCEGARSTRRESQTLAARRRGSHRQYRLNEAVREVLELTHRCGARGPALKNLSRPKVEWGLIWSPAH
jgi:hypothetical protein